MEIIDGCSFWMIKIPGDEVKVHWTVNDFFFTPEKRFFLNAEQLIPTPDMQGPQEKVQRIVVKKQQRLGQKAFAMVGTMQEYVAFLERLFGMMESQF
jgi:hypothetical protein